MSGRTDLGLPDDAPVAVVRKRFRALAKLAHPDVGGTAAEFVRVRDAYRRALRERPVNGGRSSFSHDDEPEVTVREPGFTGWPEPPPRRTGFHAHGFKRPRTRAETEAHEAIEDLASRMRAAAQTTCDVCGGKGYRSYRSSAPKHPYRVPCSTCRSSGRVFVPGTCLRCSGGGMVHVFDDAGSRPSRCPSCDGTGRVA
jgi:hypothetical protein